MPCQRAERATSRDCCAIASSFVVNLPGSRGGVKDGIAVLDPILDHWARKGKPEAYPSGMWGPESANKMLARDGRTWRRP